MNSDLLEFSDLKQCISGFVSSDIGREALGSLVPFPDWDQIALRWDETAEMMALIEAGTDPCFGAIDEIGAILELREGAILEGQDIVRVGNSLKAVTRAIRGVAGTAKLARFGDAVADFSDLCREIDMSLLPNGEVSDRSNPYLKEMRSRLWTVRSQIIDRLEQLMRELPEHAVMDELVTTRNERYVIPVRHDYAPRFRGIAHDYSRSRQTVYIEPMEMVDDNNTVNRIRSEIREEECRVLRNLTADIIGDAATIRAGLAVYATLDLIHGCAAWAVRNRCVIPAISADEINIKSARHPLLIQRLGRENTVPLDIRLSGERRCLVISGPNAGGKTVALKTLGLFILMAQSGIPFPADPESVIPRLGRLWVDMDTSQDIAHDLSSFTAHALNLKTIYEGLSGDDLVLLDEPGAATDNEQGGAFAVAYIDAVLRRNAYIVVTSHSELIKLYAVKSDLAENAAVAFDENGLRPNYRLEYGLVGGSHALEILRSVDFPDEIVASAAEIVSARGQSSLSRVLRDYSEAAEMRQQAADELQRARQCLAEARQSALHDQRERRDMALKFKRLLQKAEKMALHPVAQEKLAEIQSRPEAVELDAALQTKPCHDKELFNIGAGCIVTVRGGSSFGVVLEINGGSALVDCGGKRLRLALDLLEPAAEQSRPGGGKKWVTYRPCANPVVRPIVVVGMRVDEALGIVEKAADRAMLSGQDELEIIHGGGTGTLKNAVREYLKGVAGVVYVGDAAPDGGGGTRTIVRFGGNG